MMQEVQFRFQSLSGNEEAPATEPGLVHSGNDNTIPHAAFQPEAAWENGTNRLAKKERCGAHATLYGVKRVCWGMGLVTLRMKERTACTRFMFSIIRVIMGFQRPASSLTRQPDTAADINAFRFWRTNCSPGMSKQRAAGSALFSSIWSGVVVPG